MHRPMAPIFNDQPPEVALPNLSSPPRSGAQRFADANSHLDYDVLIIGAGLSGIYSLYRMRALGLRVRALETGSGEGGTWFFNRYPGARFDSESWSYGFSFSKEVLDEWEWTEHFAPQPETLRYAQFLTDKFDLRRDMQFNTTIESAHYQDKSNSWLLTDQTGKTYSSRYLLTAIGILNNFTPPNIPGVHDFKGKAWHTSRWPADDSDLDGKRVGIIGTGATGIQVIQTIASRPSSLTVFQRTPNWSAPLRNSKISKEEMQSIRKRYPEIFEACLSSHAGFVHRATTLNTLEMTPEERNAAWEALYAQPGFAKFLGVNSDIFTNRQANKLYSDWMADKIRGRVHDPIVAEKLIPKNHGFGTRRLPLESGYFEVFNQPNVHLVDVVADPIERISEAGIKTRDELHELDVLIYATGFDAVTGSFRAIDFQGRNNKKLIDTWSGGIRTYLGLNVEDFPNMFMVMGPHQVSTFMLFRSTLADNSRCLAISHAVSNTQSIGSLTISNSLKTTASFAQNAHLTKFKNGPITYMTAARDCWRTKLIHG